eukprot:3198823-Pleurochrysis_carterae.AAC.2
MNRQTPSKRETIVEGAQQRYRLSAYVVSSPWGWAGRIGARRRAPGPAAVRGVAQTTEWTRGRNGGVALLGFSFAVCKM